MSVACDRVKFTFTFILNVMHHSVGMSHIRPIIIIIIIIIIISGCAAQRGLWPPHHTRFHDHTQRRTTVGRIPLDE
jgi:hypothetical protein